MALLPTSLPSSRCPPVKAQQCSYPLSYTSSIHPSMLPPLFNIALMFSWDFFCLHILPSFYYSPFLRSYFLFTSFTLLLHISPPTSFLWHPTSSTWFLPWIKIASSAPLSSAWHLPDLVKALLSLYTSTLASLLQSYLNPFLSFPSYTSVADLLTFLLSITLPYPLDSSPAFS